MRAYDPTKAAQYHDEIHAHVPSEPALRVKALESLLVEKGLVVGTDCVLRPLARPSTSR
jgi:nitrile hydratase subunit alpha